MTFSRDTYYALLESPHWDAFRRRIIAERGHTCEICGKQRERGLQVHHKRYIEGLKPWEYRDADLMCLCSECHHELHLSLAEEGRKIPLVDASGKPFVPAPEDACPHCGGTGLMEDFPYLMGGLCFHCFGTGLIGLHRYTPGELKKYSLKIYHDWIGHHESESWFRERADLRRFKSQADVRAWLEEINAHL